MNWMANSKGRIQKRKSTSINLQRSFFAGHNKMRSSNTVQPDQRHTYLDKQHGKIHRDIPQLLSPKLPQQQQNYEINELEREILWPNYDRDYDRVQEGSRLGSVVESSIVQGRDILLKTRIKTDSSVDGFPKKLMTYSRRHPNTIPNVKTNNYSRSESHNAMGEVHRLREIIIDQKREIQRLQEKLLTYEKEPCADRLIKGCDSGGSRSLLAGAEEFVARNVNTTRDGISNNGKMPWISRNDNARVTINICAGSIAYNHYNSNSTPNTPGHHFVTQNSTKDYKLLNCALNNHVLGESAKMQGSRELGYIINKSSTGETDTPFFGAVPRIELLNE